MIFWYTKLVMGWMVCRKQGIEKTVELTFISKHAKTLV